MPKEESLRRFVNGGEGLGYFYSNNIPSIPITIKNIGMFSKISIDHGLGSTVDFDKEKLLIATQELSLFIMETEEKVLVEALSKFNHKALLRLKKIIDESVNI